MFLVHQLNHKSICINKAAFLSIASKGYVWIKTAFKILPARSTQKRFYCYKLFVSISALSNSKGSSLDSVCSGGSFEGHSFTIQLSLSIVWHLVCIMNYAEKETRERERVPSLSGYLPKWKAMQEKQQLRKKLMDFKEKFPTKERKKVKMTAKTNRLVKLLNNKT